MLGVLSKCLNFSERRPWLQMSSYMTVTAVFVNGLRRGYDEMFLESMWCRIESTACRICRRCGSSPGLADTKVLRPFLKF
jgi:hypothetical protein